MIIQPRIHGFICTTAHPLGCTVNTDEQIDYVRKQMPLIDAPKKVLVIGASTGYGLASRVVAAFGAKAQTIGVFFERPADTKRTASAGWYNMAAFENSANAEGIYAKSINGDAFSPQIKRQTIELIKRDWRGGVDLVIYSLAAPRRTDANGVTYNSVLKTTALPFTNKTLDVFTGLIKQITIEPATETEIADTIKVMGGEDWEAWIDALLEHDCLAKDATTIAYSYIGPELTYPIYHHGTIGKAKAHLENTATIIDKKLRSLNAHAYISINKALVTQASSAIPIVPLYISILYQVMKAKNLHEGCIEQIMRLFSQFLYTGKSVPVDHQRFIRIDNWEMRADVQQKVATIWQQINSDNSLALADLVGYRHDFNRLFGFEIRGVNYAEDIEINVAIQSIN